MLSWGRILSNVSRAWHRWILASEGILTWLKEQKTAEESATKHWQVSLSQNVLNVRVFETCYLKPIVGLHKNVHSALTMSWSCRSSMSRRMWCMSVDCASACHVLCVDFVFGCRDDSTHSITLDKREREHHVTIIRTCHFTTPYNPSSTQTNPHSASMISTLVVSTISFDLLVFNQPFVTSPYTC